MNPRRISLLVLMAAALVPEYFCPSPVVAQSSTNVSPVAPRKDRLRRSSKKHTRNSRATRTERMRITFPILQRSIRSCLALPSLLRTIRF